MKAWFFAAILIVLPVLILGLLLYSFFKYLWTLVRDRSLYRELDAIAAEYRLRRAEQSQENAARLNNGCTHAFDSGLSSGFPPGVCPKCGLAKVKPRGPCDHVWKRTEDPVPASRCTKCERQYRASEAK